MPQLVADLAAVQHCIASPNRGQLAACADQIKIVTAGPTDTRVLDTRAVCTPGLNPSVSLQPVQACQVLPLLAQQSLELFPAQHWSTCRSP